LNDNCLSSVAGNNLIGIVTSPKEMLPLHI
jgi:hypothetical protein